MNIKDIKNLEKGYVINCHIIPKDDQEGAMFRNLEDGICTAHLDGYAIIPVEAYEKLKAAQPVNLGRSIRDAHKAP